LLSPMQAPINSQKKTKKPHRCFSYSETSIPANKQKK
jgi:hypothetical protein